MKLEIITDHKWKPFKYYHEVPNRVLERQFGHLREEFGEGEYTEDYQYDGYLQYRKRWYHLSDFMGLHNKIHMPNNPFPAPWHGYMGDSFFFGVLIELSGDGEMYRIGTYTVKKGNRDNADTQTTESRDSITR